jgi:hypothetical protein
LVGDLQGFWDMMMLQVENIDAAFDDLRQCRENGWKVAIPNFIKINSFKLCNFRNQNRQAHKHQKAVV